MLLIHDQEYIYIYFKTRIIKKKTNMADKYEVDEEKDNDNSDVDSEDMTDDEDKESSQFSESSEEEDDASDTGLTENQNRLLYLQGQNLI